MKTIYKGYALIVCAVCFLCAMGLTSCVTKINNNDYESGDSVRVYYTKGDFDSIVIEKSTFRDVFDIAPAGSMHVTSYGGYCDYPMKDGRYIRIEFYGKDLIVGDIKEVS